MNDNARDISDDQPATRICSKAKADFALVRELVGGVYIVQDGRITYANPALARILGRQPDELYGASPLAFFHPEDRALAQETVRRRLDGEVQEARYEARCLRKDGEVVYVEVLGVRADYGGEPVLIGTVLDVTDRKRAEMVIEERLRSERLLADLSTAFVNVPSERLDDLIHDSLRISRGVSRQRPEHSHQVYGGQAASTRDAFLRRCRL